MAFLNLFGNKIRAKDVYFQNGNALDTSSQWVEVGSTNAGATKTFTVDTDKWNECLIVCGQNGGTVGKYRVLASTVVPKAMFNIGKDETEGLHQAMHYNSASDKFKAGISFISSTQVKVYVSSIAVARLYYR
jgi:hypothetical protein